MSPNLPSICVALSGPNMLTRAAALAPEHTFFELRLDTVPNPAALLPKLALFLQQTPAITVIATCRRIPNGGQFQGSPQQEFDYLTQAAAIGAHLLDLSLETAEDLTATNPTALSTLQHTKAKLLLSWHDFQSTPNLEAVYQRMQKHAPHLYKIVPTAQTLRDSFRVLDLLENHAAEQNLIGMAMGTPGILTRVLGPRFGAIFTFAAPDAQTATAPGQLDLHTLRDLYRLDQITPATRIYGVFGKPITGSKSPVMLNTAFRETETDAVYLPLETADPDELFEAMHRLPLSGASVTMPLKEQILPRIQNLDPFASRIGAANTLGLIQNDAVIGYNTDAAGITDPLAKRIRLQGAIVLVLGAGGAARAAVFALRSHGATVTVLNRTHGKAEHLARESGITAIHRQDLLGKHFDVILNATPYGMTNQQIEAPITPAEMNCNLFFDLVYNPLETALIAIARQKNIPVLHGIEMFLAQGAAQFHLWTHKPAPLTAMRKAVLAELTTTNKQKRT